MEPFGTRLRRATDDRGQLCVGLDPHASLLEAWGVGDTVDGLERFSMTCVEALASRVAVIKPQSAFFERHGSPGIAVLERAVAAARDAGALVLLDAKRGDIGSTMQGYAEAYLDQGSAMAVDAITVSPYLGFESLRPMLDTAAMHGAGVFVLALTSNPEGPTVQLARHGSETVAGEILDALRRENAASVPLGSFGAVVASNLAELSEDLAINGPLLAPGFGAQGGTAEDVRRIFAGVEANVLPSTSRDVLRAGPSVDALRATAEQAAEAVAAAVGR
ncbi:MAG: orotidine-5'-phosphate decarboxylase [Nocardioidaceae bacterium]